MGKRGPKPGNARPHNVQVRLSADEQDALSQTAERYGVSLSDLVRIIPEELGTCDAVLRSILDPVRGQLCKPACMLVLDALNGCSTSYLYGGMPLGAGMVHEVADHIRLNQADAKWDVSAERVVPVLEGWTPEQRAALTAWCGRLWMRPSADWEPEIEWLSGHCTGDGSHGGSA